MEKISILWYHLSPKISVFCEAVANYITKLRGLKPHPHRASFRCWLQLQIISQNYVVWNRFHLLCVIVFLFQLQIISQNYVVWNTARLNDRLRLGEVANYITKLRGLKLFSGLKTDSYNNMLQIISQNYVVWNDIPAESCSPWHQVANYITKLRGLKPR